jgi:phospholipid-translocating ATPase
MVVPDILRLEFKLVSIHTSFAVLCIADVGLYSVFEYTYLLFWNSFWTLAPVIGIGLFDRVIGECLRVYMHSRRMLTAHKDASALMEQPQLYSYSRLGTWFGMKWFVIYMFDGVVQVS